MAGLGIFGGTFDPPHLGHLILAAEAKYQLDLDRLLWVLTPNSPLKQGQRKAAMNDRLDMVQAAIADNPDFQISLVEVNRPGPHYALETVELIQSDFPDEVINYLMGADSLLDLPLWHRPQVFVQACAYLGVMRRPGYMVDLDALELDIPGLAAKVRYLDTPLLEISSRDLRQRIAHDAPVRYYLSYSVLEIIESRGLYR